MFRADLHCHSTCSDGTLSPEELLKLAQERGLSGLSITDHDTIDAYKTAIPAAKALGIRLGTGVELSCEHLETSVHILGYDYSLTTPSIKALCARHQRRRTERNRLILANLKKHKMPIEEEELQKFGQERTIGRPHIAQLMIEKGYVKTVKEAFNRYLGEGKSCYAQGAVFTALEAIEVLHQAGGKAFLAHPQLLPKTAPLKEILQLPFDGLECYYSLFGKETSQKWLEIAEKKKWLVSGGSDFHGGAKPDVVLGCSFVDQETFEKIFSHDLSRSD